MNFSFLMYSTLSLLLSLDFNIRIPMCFIVSSASYLATTFQFDNSLWISSLVTLFESRVSVSIRKSRAKQFLSLLMNVELLETRKSLIFMYPIFNSFSLETKIFVVLYVFINTCSLNIFIASIFFSTSGFAFT